MIVCLIVMGSLSFYYNSKGTQIMCKSHTAPLYFAIINYKKPYPGKNNPTGIIDNRPQAIFIKSTRNVSSSPALTAIAGHQEPGSFHNLT